MSFVTLKAVDVYEPDPRVSVQPDGRTKLVSAEPAKTLTTVPIELLETDKVSAPLRVGVYEYHTEASIDVFATDGSSVSKLYPELLIVIDPVSPVLTIAAQKLSPGGESGQLRVWDQLREIFPRVDPNEVTRK